MNSKRGAEVSHCWEGLGCYWWAVRTAGEVLGLGGGSVLQRSSIKTQTGLSSKWHDTIRMLAGGRMGGVERWAWETHKVCMREDYISRFQNYQCAIVQRFLFSLVETSRWGQLYNEWLCWTISKGETRFDSPFEVPISRFFVFYDARTWQVNICCVDFSPSDDIHERNVVSRCVGLETLSSNSHCRSKEENLKTPDLRLIRMHL